ncbi:DUF6378 domain-containing protein [Saccharopolyspora shandongensis]|uniref:DUF6378 domain-containing protein n=1 Tax=Saccharopolyspora shandongensis TaxID=418495 RepID=UPI003405EC35
MVQVWRDCDRAIDHTAGRPADVPDNYLGVPIPDYLRPNWNDNRVEVHWWRRGVKSAVESAESGETEPAGSACGDIGPDGYDCQRPIDHVGVHRHITGRQWDAWASSRPAEVPDTPRAAVLAEASELIHGDRNASYGPPMQNFRRIADMWNVVLVNHLSEPVTPRQVADMMICLKVARNVEAPKRDNYVDIAGYAACGQEIAEGEW